MAHPDSPLPPPAPGRDPAARGRLAAAALLAAWTLLLASGALAPRSPLATAGLVALRSAPEILALGRRFLGWAALEALRFAPLGVVAVLALPDRERFVARLGRVALPGAVLASACALAALGLAGRSVPSALGAAVPIAGALVGVAAGLAWRRGARARLLLLPRLAALALALLLAAAGLAWLALETEPRVPAPAPVTSADKRAIVAAARGHDPRRIPAGESRVLRLTGRDIERLVAWGFEVRGSGRGTAALEGPGRASLAISLRVPRTGRWLNVAAAVRLRIENGRIDFTISSLSAGPVSVPGPALALLAGGLVSAARSDPRLRQALASVRSLRIDPEALEMSVEHSDLAGGLLSQVVWGEEQVRAVRAAVAPHVAHLLGVLPFSPRGDARFTAALQASFTLARQRSRGGSALTESRSALVALGAVLGHERLASVVGVRLDEPTISLIRRLRGETTVRGRADWVRHFTVSGALTVLSWVAPSDAAGLLKEELDADGGSGFSFGDLLADRAGTTFADVATRDERAAAAMQERLAREVRIEALFPPAADMPEGIQDRELQARYGGVGGPLYRRWADEIEQRLAACALYHH